MTKTKSDFILNMKNGLLDILITLLEHKYNEEISLFPEIVPDLCTEEGVKKIKETDQPKILQLSHNLFNCVNEAYNQGNMNLLFVILNKMCGTFKTVKYFIECGLFDVILSHINGNQAPLSKRTSSFMGKNEIESHFYYNRSTVSNQELELFYTLLHRSKFTYQSVEPTSYVEIKLSKDSIETLSSLSFLMSCKDIFEKGNIPLIKNIIKQLYSVKDDHFSYIVDEYITKINNNMDEKSSYMLYVYIFYL